MEVIQYVYDGDVLPVETYHVLGKRETVCGIDVMPIRWRFSEQLPLPPAVLCEECDAILIEAQARAEGNPW